MNANKRMLAPLPSSRFVTLLAWAMMAIGAMMLPISVVSCLMLVAGSDGSQSATAGGFFTIVVLPALTLAGGLGLKRRRRWAYWYTVALLIFLLAWNIWLEITAPAPGVYYSASGVKTTISGSDTSYILPMSVIGLGLLALLLRRKVRAEFGMPPITFPVAPGNGKTMPVGHIPGPALDDRGDQSGLALLRRVLRRGRGCGDSGWRVGHQGRDNVYYEEWQRGGWRRIVIGGEMLAGRAHHVIYVPSPDRWREYPEWVRDRREQVIQRLNSRLQPPEYEYLGGEDVSMKRQAAAGDHRRDARSAGAASSPAAPRTRRAVSTARVARAGRSHWKVYTVVLAVLLCTTGFTGWLVADGIRTGETRMLARPPAPRRLVSRTEDPGLFWASLALYGAIGLGTAGLALWGIRQVVRDRGDN